jgi:hypothetical protein
MNSSTKCKHKPVHEIENKLYPDYDDGLFQRMYIELKEEVRQSEIKKGKDLTVVKPSDCCLWC